MWPELRVLQMRIYDDDEGRQNDADERQNDDGLLFEMRLRKLHLRRNEVKTRARVSSSV